MKPLAVFAASPAESPPAAMKSLHQLTTAATLFAKASQDTTAAANTARKRGMSFFMARIIP